MVTELPNEASDKDFLGFSLCLATVSPSFKKVFFERERVVYIEKSKTLGELYSHVRDYLKNLVSESQLET